MTNEEILKQEWQKKVAELTVRAAHHGVQLEPGEPILVAIEKLVARMDAYRDVPEKKGRLIVDD